MKKRCNQSTVKNYQHYGGRGITFDSNWENFADFLTDMGKKPLGMQLDRIDNDGNYTEDNCRWATPLVNTNNRRNTIYITVEGITQPLTYWARQLGISADVIRNRRKRGWPQERWFEPLTIRNIA
jgi:hypothetical protein